MLSEAFFPRTLGRAINYNILHLNILNIVACVTHSSSFQKNDSYSRQEHKPHSVNSRL